MARITRPGPELRVRMESFHPELTALIDELRSQFDAKLLSFKSETADIDVVAKRVAEAGERCWIRIWPETSAQEARENESAKGR